MSGGRERKHLSPEANNHPGSEAVETKGKELQSVSISDGSNKNNVRELGALDCIEPLACNAKMTIGSAAHHRTNARLFRFP